jgi:hypothetical protein
VFALLLILGFVLGGVAYLATYKLPHKRRLVVAGLAVALLGVLVAGFALFFDDVIDCWLYYDQCTAKRISGLSEHDCLKRADVVAYLLTDGICLVKNE